MIAVPGDGIGVEPGPRRVPHSTLDVGVTIPLVQQDLALLRDQHRATEIRVCRGVSEDGVEQLCERRRLVCHRGRMSLTGGMNARRGTDLYGERQQNDQAENEWTMHPYNRTHLLRFRTLMWRPDK
jgi:hypothetical protein